MMPVHAHACTFCSCLVRTARISSTGTKFDQALSHTVRPSRTPSNPSLSPVTIRQSLSHFVIIPRVPSPVGVWSGSRGVSSSCVHPSFVKKRQSCVFQALEVGSSLDSEEAKAAAVRIQSGIRGK
eukprot:1643024-Pleurochrysis_carterae.AAC.3